MTRFIDNEILLKNTDGYRFIFVYEDMEVVAFKDDVQMKKVVIPYPATISQIDQAAIDLFRKCFKNDYIIINTEFNHRKLIRGDELRKGDDIYCEGEDIGRYYWGSTNNSVPDIIKKFELTEVDKHRLEHFVNKIIDYGIGKY